MGKVVFEERRPVLAGGVVFTSYLVKWLQALQARRRFHAEDMDGATASMSAVPFS